MFDAILRIGGSLYEQPAALRAALRAYAALARRHRLLVVPGGGPFADQVRTADHSFGLSDSTAHWMAILAMDQYAHLLADLAPGAQLSGDLAAAATSAAAGRLAMLAPARLLMARDPLPHSWQVTSDAIAAWLASQVDAPLLVLLKDVAGVYTSDPRVHGAQLLAAVPKSELTRYNVVDPVFATTLPARVSCWIVDGARPERLVELLERGHTIGTRVLDQAS
jgi:5-(aminomethyl)-3-furanmethanol phosphate kinase